MSESNINDPETDPFADTVEGSEEVLTLEEAFELQDNMMEETAAVLGAANEKACSYAEGYVKRQALYSCLTCIPEAKQDPEKGAGVCLACSFHCHDGHDLVELYTKRNFRCDCGNTKFTDIKCNLQIDKNDLNDLNSYNQNFSGMYCVCHRPFPDPEDPVPDEMIQCIICEDWYHTRHLGTEVPSANFAEMICEACVTKHEFLLHYDAHCLNKIAQPEDQKKNTEGSESVPSTSDSYCKKPQFKSPKVSARFWAEVDWRKELCTCDDCLRMYENEDVAFLLDSEDPVHLYEEKGKARIKELEEKSEDELIESMNSMDRVALGDCIAGYNELKEELGEFLKKFVQNKRIIREADVREFFDGMNARKKQKVEVPRFCR